MGISNLGRKLGSRRQVPLELTGDQISRIRKRLIGWGRRNYKYYPWRDEEDAWLTFVAELFLQRTKARQVERVYSEFKQQYPTPHALLGADLTELQQLVGRLGLSFRVSTLLDLANAAVDKGGQLPETFEQITQFRGVGQYTASAWLSLHRGRRAALIDSNVVRWLSRMTGNPYNRDPRNLKWVHQLTEELTPTRVFRDYNYAVLDFTMSICKPRNPVCENCPIAKDCLFGRSRVESRP
jgi:A/G-specific adenine glycosylase